MQRFIDWLQSGLDRLEAHDAAAKNARHTPAVVTPAWPVNSGTRIPGLVPGNLIPAPASLAADFEKPPGASP